MSEFTNELAELVKAAGQELIDRADDLVGQGNMLSDFESNKPGLAILCGEAACPWATQR